ncbi:VOC family protein [Dehalobacter sp. TBBPA1]|uniref:VOC family protein n=1 Tax=Dehalobacter sp. TBBPA1 TaxID=3235037 RepID=UPI0034A0E9AE
MGFCLTTVNVNNLEESLKFYQEVVGLPLVQRLHPDPSTEICFLGNGETKLELIWHEGNQVNIGEDISLGFEVESIEAMLKFIWERGLSIHSGPFSPGPSVTFFFILDPNGLKIQFVENH